MTTYMIRKGKPTRYNEKFEEFVPEEGNYLFTVKTPIEDVIQAQFISDVEKLMMKGNAGDRKIKMEGIAGIFSSLLTYTPCFLYNNPGMLEAYPNGLVTNDKIFLPVPLVQQLAENERYSHIPNLLIRGLISILEQKYDVDFSADMKKLFDVNKGYFRSSRKVNELEKIPYVNAPDLQGLLVKEGISPESIQRIIDVSGTSYLDKVLHASSEINNPSHPFFQLKSQVENNVRHLTPVVKNIDVALDAYWNNMNADNIDAVLSALQHNLSNIIAAAPDFTSAVKTVEDTWFNKAVKVSSNHISDVFAMYLENMQIHYPDLGNQITAVFIEQTLIDIVKQPDVYDRVRRNLIESATGFNLSAKFENQEYKIVVKETHEVESQYFDACKKGDLEKVRELLTNSEAKIDILNDSMKGFTIACQNKHSEIATYLLSSPELDSHIPINSTSLNHIAENELKDVFEGLIKEPQLRELLLNKENGYIIMSCAGELGSIQAVRDLLEYDIPDKKLKTTNVLSKASENGHLPLVKMLLTEVFPSNNNAPNKIKNLKSMITGDYSAEILHDNIQSCFFSAVKAKKEEVVQYYLYDYNLQLTHDYAKKADEIPEIKKMIGLRELNNQLQKDLTPNEVVKPKNNKI